MKLSIYLGLLERAESALARSFRQVSDGHSAEPDIHYLCQVLASQCDEHEEALKPVVDRYGEQGDDEPDELHADAMSETRSGAVGLIRDLQDLYLLANFVKVTWMMVKQAALGLRDAELIDIVNECESQTVVQVSWLTTRMKQAAPQALIVAE